MSEHGFTYPTCCLRPGPAPSGWRTLQGGSGSGKFSAISGETCVVEHHARTLVDRPRGVTVYAAIPWRLCGSAQNTGGVGVEMAFEPYRGSRAVGPLSGIMKRSISAESLVPVHHGRINYRDIFGAPHWLSICRIGKYDEINAFTGAVGGWRDCSTSEPTDDDARRLTLV